MIVVFYWTQLGTAAGRTLHIRHLEERNQVRSWRNHGARRLQEWIVEGAMAPKKYELTILAIAKYGAMMVFQHRCAGWTAILAGGA